MRCMVSAVGVACAKVRELSVIKIVASIAEP